MTKQIFICSFFPLKTKIRNFFNMKTWVTFHQEIGKFRHFFVEKLNLKKLFAALHAEQSSASPNSRSNRRNQRRVTQDDDRYHSGEREFNIFSGFQIICFISEIRVEAVHQALAEYSDGRKLGPQPVKPHRRNGTSVSRSSSAQKSKRSNHSGRRMLSGKILGKSGTRVNVFLAG